MANSAPDLSSILAALAAQRPASNPPQGQLAPPPANYPPAQNPYPPQPPQYQQPPPSAYAYPPPSASGNIDLSAIRPSNTGTVNVNIADAIARAKAYATENNLTPYDRSSYPPPSDPRDDGRQYRQSRSPPRRDAFRDNYNPYRDERRGDASQSGGGNGYPSRDHRRDRSLSPGPRGRQNFSPHGANGRDGRDRSPLRGKDDNSETMHIESSLVGLIIGRQGENLRRIETDTHCRVQFIPAASPADEFRLCRITGPAPRRAEARAAINRIIEDSGMGAIARAGLEKSGRGSSAFNAGVPPLKEGEETLKIMVPDRTVGLIIGRGGETIRDLQERSGCHINIVGENKSINGLRPVNLIGSHEAAKHAKDLIMEIVDSDSRNAGAQPAAPRPRNENPGLGGGGPGGAGPDKINDSIYVPSEAVGMIIGKGGETIREMQNVTGCKINVSQSSGPGEVEREIGLVGSRDAINRAKQAIEEKVEAVRQKNAGGGGGRGHGRGQHRDYDSPSYGQQSHSNNSSAGQSMPPAMQSQAPADGAADPYAAYGGYQAYLAMWYQAMAAQQQTQGQPDPSKPPGTA